MCGTNDWLHCTDVFLAQAIGRGNSHNFHRHRMLASLPHTPSDFFNNTCQVLDELHMFHDLLDPCFRNLILRQSINYVNL